MKNDLFVCRASENDTHTGVVWLFRPSKKHRPVIKITNHSTNKKIYCEKLQIDEAYIDKRKIKCKINGKKNTELIFMNEWYREKLGIKSPNEWVELDITDPVVNWWGKFWACAHHPQIVIRMSMWFSTIGVGLGLLSLFISLKCQ